MVSYIPWVRIPVDFNWVLYSGSQKLKPRCQPAECSSGVLTGEIYVSLCWQNPFPCGRKPGSPPPCWPSARVTLINRCLQIARWPLSLSNRSFPSCQVLLALQVSLMPFCYQTEKTTFRGLLRLDQPHPNVICTLSSIYLGFCAREDSWKSLGGQGSPS